MNNSKVVILAILLIIAPQAHSSIVKGRFAIHDYHLFISSKPIEPYKKYMTYQQYVLKTNITQDTVPVTYDDTTEMVVGVDKKYLVGPKEIEYITGITYDRTTGGVINTEKALFSSWEYTSSYEIVPIPEPEEWMMMLFGFGMVGWQVKRKQKAAPTITR
jgi:hypothetical protein